MIGISPILAQIDYSTRLRGLQNAFQPNKAEQPDMMEILGFGAAVLAIVVALLIARAIWRRRARGGAFKRPGRLFTYVLKQMGIRLPDRLLLRLAAGSSGLKQPTLMLFSPELFERYAGHWADSIAVGVLQEHVRRRLQSIAQKAFP